RARRTALCLGPGVELALAQAVQALAIGGAALLLLDATAAEGQAVVRSWRVAGAPVAIVVMPPAFLADVDWLASVPAPGLVACAGPVAVARALRIALARRDDELVPLVTEPIAPW